MEHSSSRLRRSMSPLGDRHENQPGCGDRGDDRPDVATCGVVSLVEGALLSSRSMAPLARVGYYASGYQIAEVIKRIHASLTPQLPRLRFSTGNRRRLGSPLVVRDQQSSL